MAIRDRGAQDDAENITDIILERIGVHAGHGYGCLKPVVFFVDHLVKRFLMQQVVRRVKPHVNDERMREKLQHGVPQDERVVGRGHGTTAAQCARPLHVPRRDHHEPGKHPHVDGRQGHGVEPLFQREKGPAALRLPGDWRDQVEQRAGQALHIVAKDRAEHDQIERAVAGRRIIRQKRNRRVHVEPG